MPQVKYHCTWTFINHQRRHRQGPRNVIMPLDITSNHHTIPMPPFLVVRCLSDWQCRPSISRGHPPAEKIKRHVSTPFTPLPLLPLGILGAQKARFSTHHCRAYFCSLLRKPIFTPPVEVPRMNRKSLPSSAHTGSSSSQGSRSNHR